MSDLKLLLGAIRDRLRIAEEAAVICQGDGQDRLYVRALENVSVDAARLLAALDGVLALTDERAATLRATSDRLSQQVIDRHPDRDAAAAVRYAAYAQEAEAFTAKIRTAITTALEGQA